MEDKKKQTKLFNFFIVLVMLSSFALSRTKILNKIGELSLLIISFFLIIFIYKNRIKIKINSIFIIMIIYIIYNVLNSNTILNVTTTKLIYLMVTFYLIFIVFNSLDYTSISFTMFRILNIVVWFVVIAGTILLKFNNKILFTNTAGIAHISFEFLILNYILYSIKKTNKMSFLIYLPLLILSNGRIQIFAIVVIYAITFFGKKVIAKKIIYWMILIIFICTAVYITYSYPKWYHQDFFINLNIKVRKLTNKNLFSGRQILWESALNEVEGHEVWGLGSDAVFENYYFENQISIHNQYLQIYYTGGIIGITIFLLFIVNMWKKMYQIRNSKLGIFTISFFLSFLIINIFSISLLQNNTSVAITFWTILSMAIKISKNKEVDKLNENRNINIS